MSDYLVNLARRSAGLVPVARARAQPSRAPVSAGRAESLGLPAPASRTVSSVVPGAPTTAHSQPIATSAPVVDRLSSAGGQTVPPGMEPHPERQTRSQPAPGGPAEYDLVLPPRSRPAPVEEARPGHPPSDTGPGPHVRLRVVPVQRPAPPSTGEHTATDAADRPGPVTTPAPALRVALPLSVDRPVMNRRPPNVESQDGIEMRVPPAPRVDVLPARPRLTPDPPLASRSGVLVPVQAVSRPRNLVVEPSAERRVHVSIGTIEIRGAEPPPPPPRPPSPSPHQPRPHRPASKSSCGSGRTRHGTADPGMSDFKAIGGASATLQALLTDRMELPAWIPLAP